MNMKQRILAGALAALVAPLAVLGGASPASAAPAVPDALAVPDAPAEADASVVPDAPDAAWWASAAASATAEEVTSGDFSWGVRYSIRNYLENFDHTEGWVAGSGGATYKKGDKAAVFPVESGTVDPESETAELRIGGALDMYGFGEDWLHFEDLRLAVEGGTATLTVDMLKSYNVKERTDDLVLSTWAVDALEIADGTLSLTTGQGRFSNAVAVDHLPSYGGPTYAAPNDYTDPFTLKLGFGERVDDGSDDEGEPATGPYGTSTGTAYSDNSAVIRVKPGYALNADGSTEITLTGTGFSPGTEAAPANLYVGIGTMKDFAQPEKWRRSKGGTSGPVGAGDYTYGNPLMIASTYSPDADVANGAMDANGSWTATMTVPGKDVVSFFGDTIDCLTNQCGVFAFGAHGVINAKNEAFTPVYFDGQDESGWPGRDDGGEEEPPPVVPPTDPEDPDDPDDAQEPGEKNCEPNGESSAQAASGAKLTVSPAKCLGDSEQLVQIRGENFPTTAADGTNFGGVYVLFGWVDQSLDGKWGPGQGGSSGITYAYAKDGIPSGSYQTMVNYPGNTTEPDVPYMDANGDWETSLPIKESRFVSVAGTSIDCYQVTCGIITLGAHGKANTAAETFTPVYFTGDPKATGTGKPETPGGNGPTANPNATGPATAANAAGGLATTGSTTRLALMLGVLILSASVFAFSMTRLRGLPASR